MDINTNEYIQNKVHKKRKFKEYLRKYLPILFVIIFFIIGLLIGQSGNIYLYSNDNINNCDNSNAQIKNGLDET